MKKITLITTVSIMALSLSACMHDSALDKAPGTYTSTKTATDANGTDYKKTTTTDVSVDANGKKKAVVTSKKTADPKGLFNKQTTTDQEVIEEK